MRIHVGGFCLQGLVAIPVLEKLLSEKKQRLEIIANGLAGFYAILFESFGKEEARKRLQGFIKKFEGTLRVINRRQKSENIDKKTARKKQIEYCVLWSTSIAAHTWEQADEFLTGLSGNTSVKAEVIDLSRQTVELYEASSVDVARACLAFPGVFPLFKGKYVNTTYLSQIPVSFLEDGDTVVVNLRDPSRIEFESASEILLQAMECRMIELAKRSLASKDVRKIEIMTQVHWKDIKGLETSQWRFLESVEFSLSEIEF